jgi:predicted NBD/HSP70 family sugar kinase
VGDLYALIRDERDLTRAEIGKLTGLSRTAVNARVRELTSRDLVIEHEQAPSTGGRPATLLRFNADAGVVLTAAVGGSRTRLGVCNLAGDVLTAADVDQEPGRGPGDLMPEVVQRLGRLLADSGREGSPVLGVGLSLPGTVDQAWGSSVDTPVLSRWDGTPLIPFFRELTDAPVLLGNDANAVALAEWRVGAGRGFDDLLVVKASTGLGAGIIAGGALQHGAIRAAGEFAHNKVAAAAERACRCGDIGCLETVAGGWALAGMLRQEGRQVQNLRDVVALAHSGDALARRVIRESGRHVGEVLAAAVNLLNPAALVVAGDVAGAYDIFVAGLRETLYRNASALATRGLEVRPALLGDRGGVVGSAMMVLDEVLGARAVDAIVTAP